MSRQRTQSCQDRTQCRRAVHRAAKTVHSVAVPYTELPTPYTVSQGRAHSCQHRTQRRQLHTYSFLGSRDPRRLDSSQETHVTFYMDLAWPHKKLCLYEKSLIPGPLELFVLSSRDAPGPSYHMRRLHLGSEQ